MGNTSQASGSYSSTKQDKFTHPKFQKAKQRESVNNDIVIQTQLSLQNEDLYRKWAEKVKQNPGIGEEGVLIPLSHSYKRTGICGSNGIAQITYENYPFTLKDQINNRQGIQQKLFNEPELWYLLAILTSSAEKYHCVGKRVGDIRPANVFINENGEVKLGTQYSWPNELTNFQKSYQSGTKTYLAPQECRDLQLGKDQTIAHVSAAQAFSTGLTLLDSSLLYDFEKFYDENCILNFQKLKSLKNELKNAENYTFQFKCVLLALLQLTPERRLSLMELKDFLDPYMGQILDLQPFRIQNFPQKIKQVIIDENLKEDQVIRELNSPICQQTKDSPQNRKMIESLGSKSDNNDITFTFGRKDIHRCKQDDKTREATTMVRSQMSNFVKVQSPYEDNGKKQERLPIVYNESSPRNSVKMSRPLILKRELSNELLHYTKSPQAKPKVNIQVQHNQYHPYYQQGINTPRNSEGVLPLVNKVSLKEEGKLRVNFSYQDSKPEYIPSVVRRIDNSSNKMIPSDKTLKLESVKHSKRDFVEMNKDCVNAEYFPSCSSINNESKLQNRKERSNSLKDLDQKIALSRRMFPY